MKSKLVMEKLGKYFSRVPFVLANIVLSSILCVLYVNLYVFVHVCSKYISGYYKAWHRYSELQQRYQLSTITCVFAFIL